MFIPAPLTKISVHYFSEDFIPFQIILESLLVSGEIKQVDLVKLMDYGNNVSILSDCHSVHIISSSTLTTNEDIIVDDIRYRSESQINQIVPTNFTISINSNDYSSNTTLHWSCTQWGEWTSLRDGSCRCVIRPVHNGTMTRGLLKYKLNENCSKFLFCSFSTKVTY